jgi:hypothetical protein
MFEIGTSGKGIENVKPLVADRDFSASPTIPTERFEEQRISLAIVTLDRAANPIDPLPAGRHDTPRRRIGSGIHSSPFPPGVCVKTCLRAL